MFSFGHGAAVAFAVAVVVMQAVVAAPVLQVVVVVAESMLDWPATLHSNFVLVEASQQN